MAIYTGAYVGARTCTSGPQPGAWGAMDYFMSAHKSDGAVNSGIYNCRTVRGGRTTSIHGEGRAADFGIRPYSARWGWALANALVAMSDELGVQCVIWDRKIWSCSYPHSGWRNYGGTHPHTDHIHVEFTWARANAGRSATAKHFAKVLGGIKPEDVNIGGGGGGSTYKTITGKTPTVRLYHKGEPVRRVQAAVGVKVDGYYGPATVTKVKAFQRKHGLAADGIVGKLTWAKINAGGSSGGSGKSSVKAKSGEAFPWPVGHWAGVESKDSRNHSGYHKADQAGVKVIQKAVGVKADGVYGPATRTAVIAWQKRNGVTADGYFGEASWAKLDTRKSSGSGSSSGGIAVDGIWGKGTTRAVQKAVGVKQDGIRGRATVRAIQKRVGVKQDAIWGRETVRGIQRRVGVKADGIIGPNTVKALQRALNAGKF